MQVVCNILSLDISEGEVEDSFLQSLSNYDEFQTPAGEKDKNEPDLVTCPNTVSPTNEEISLLESLEMALAVGIMAGEGLKYIAGYVAWRLSRDTSLCVCTSSLTQKRPGEWIDHLSRGYLKSPTEKMVTAARVMTEKFKKYHRATFSKESRMFETVALQTSTRLTEKINMKVLLCLRASCKQK
ncbi:uncharacterized protein LOC117174375 isoform X2 [Belonocnema kinseyi]|uniref:uncharacterized protein LOC117174375 isoform X2 n=1 Tax=Belonocnema kinseyi TaxID=2817044 RepID=UPI00143CC0BC|nr:uncharacterized protein LOC117174375 isoform X2 [Belonocnema kinseyi]